MKTIAAVLSVVVILSSRVWAETPATRPAPSEFTGVKEVRLSREAASSRGASVVIADKARIERLVETIKLEKKEPCACLHLESAVFVKDKGGIRVSLCDHCFDFGGKTYGMPPEFYKLFQTYLSEAAMQPASASRPAASQPASRSVDANAVADLIRKLGDNQYKVREQASRDLIQLGLTAQAALEAGLNDPNPEIQSRCRQLLELAKAKDMEAALIRYKDGMEAALARLLADKDGTQRHQLGGWERYRKQVGADDSARQLFVQMQRTDPVLLYLVDHDPKKAGLEYADRVASFQEKLYGSRDGRIPPPAPSELATLLFVGSHPAVTANTDENGVKRGGPLPGGWLSPLGPVVNANSMVLKFLKMPQVIQSATTSAPTRKLLIDWLNCRTEAALVGDTLSLTRETGLMRETIDLAVRAAKDKSEHPWVRATALWAIGHVGGKEHLPVLETLLGDGGELGEYLSTYRKNIKVYAQVGDVALAMLVHLTGQQYKDYGFDVLETIPEMRIDLSSKELIEFKVFGFSTNEKRDEAIKKWKEWSAKIPASGPASQPASGPALTPRPPGPAARPREIKSPISDFRRQHSEYTKTK